MPYLPTSQAFLDQSFLLLEAYPDTTRITTKYSFPSTRRRKSSSTNPLSQETDTNTTDQQQQQQQPPIATLTLKTFNPEAGLCLKYRTNKAAEVGRLMLGLGRLAAGKDVSAAALGGGGVAPQGSAAAGGDVEMVDAEAAATAGNGAISGKNDAVAGKGGKGKKKGGKGKR